MAPTLRDFDVIGNFKSSLGDSYTQPRLRIPSLHKYPSECSRQCLQCTLCSGLHDPPTPPQRALPLPFPSQTSPRLYFILSGLRYLKIYTLNLLRDSHAPWNGGVQIHNLLASISGPWASVYVTQCPVKIGPEARGLGVRSREGPHVFLPMQRAGQGCPTPPGAALSEQRWSGYSVFPQGLAVVTQVRSPVVPVTLNQGECL